MASTVNRNLVVLLEGLGVTADELQHLAAIFRERERRRDEEHTARLAETLWDRPTVGAIRRAARKESS
ncbi:MAG TPA: hypothetical protein VLL25_20225 [Acidimicrobiales bacterium]|nr:hypothetical protein [Acidimicrobiales bacterium]